MLQNQIIYLAFTPKHFMKEISIKEWNDIIESYEKDPKAIVEPWMEAYDGYAFVTTSLFNLLKNHSALDMRFCVRERTGMHKTDYILDENETLFGLELKKDHYYTCIRGYSDDGWCKFGKGDTVLCEKDGCIIDGYGIEHHFGDLAYVYFRDATPEEIAHYESEMEEN